MLHTDSLYCSAYSNLHGHSYSHGAPGFSFHQTVPSQGDDSSHIWNEGISEDSQNFHDSSSNNQYQNRIEEAYSPFLVQDVQGSDQTCQGSISGRNQSHWGRELSASLIGSQEMSRMPSQDSIGAHSHRTTHSSVANSYDHSRSTSLYPNMSQVPFSISSASSDMTGMSNSPDSTALYTPTPRTDGQPFEQFPFQGIDETSQGGPVFHHRGSTSAVLSNVITGTSYNNPFAISGDDTFLTDYVVGQGAMTQDSLQYHSNSIDQSPTLWADKGVFVDSQNSSPIDGEDPWALPLARLTTSNNSPLRCSPSVQGLSPAGYIQDCPEMAELSHTAGSKPIRKSIGSRQSKVNNGIARHSPIMATSEMPEESLKYTGRTDMDNNARVHHLYQDVAPKADGLYHCPWEGQESCQHKPEKLKCNYDKAVDSHLKPYRCKVSQCENVQFSSTACLLRHEREAHAMHGHGEKPFLCTHEGCDRGVTGNGFPRHWNLRDHMRRVHNDPGPPKSSTSGSSPPPSVHVRGKKRKDRPHSPVLGRHSENIVKRSSTPRDPKQETRKPSPSEHYQQIHKMFLDTAVKLQDPGAPDYISLCQQAENYWRRMIKTGEEINIKDSYRLDGSITQKTHKASMRFTQLLDEQRRTSCESKQIKFFICRQYEQYIDNSSRTPSHANKDPEIAVRLLHFVDDEDVYRKTQTRLQAHRVEMDFAELLDTINRIGKFTS